MKHPAPTRADHEKFCNTEGWTRVRDARGRSGTHHVTYELALPDGRVLRTRISHPPDRTTYGPSIWAHILRDQLDVDEDAFWACVRSEQNPDRGHAEPDVESLPADVVHQLIVRFRVPESEVRTLDRERAMRLLQEFWSRER